MISRANAYDRAIAGLSGKIREMGSLVTGQLTLAMQALQDQDFRTATAVLDTEEKVDTKQLEIEMEALELMLLQQPTEPDLRVLLAIMRITRDLERIGDYAADIADITLALLDKGPYFKPLVDVPLMYRLARDMLCKALDACVNKDIAAAGELHRDDDPIDDLFQRLHEELVGFMKQGPQYVDQASNLLLVARYLERIGDHAVNIGEMTIFALTGERRPYRDPARN